MDVAEWSATQMWPVDFPPLCVEVYHKQNKPVCTWKLFIASVYVFIVLTDRAPTLEKRGWLQIRSEVCRTGEVGGRVRWFVYLIGV